MKIPVITILAAAGMVAQAHGEPDARAATVTVYVRAGVGDPDLKLFLAEGIASRMFAKAGVHIQWRTDRPKLDEPNPPILLDITSNTPATLKPGALAYALVYEGVHIKVFWDRVQESAKCNPGLAHKLLAHVMVHEITHVLQRINRHSADGVMKARWTQRDILQMGRKPLPFEGDDIWWIHDGLAARASAIQRVLAAANTEPLRSTECAPPQRADHEPAPAQPSLARKNLPAVVVLFPPFALTQASAPQKGKL
jgi:hypothetical protein